MSATFDWPVRVYYEDTDAAGIVYHARYLHFAERARTEMLRSLGFDHRLLRSEYDTVFAVHGCELFYRKVAKLDDALVVSCRVKEFRGLRLDFEQIVRRQTEIVCEMTIKLVVLNGALRPRRPPDDLVQAFLNSRPIQGGE